MESLDLYLHPFDSIGWDFDGTLSEHENSKFFRQYILNNQHKKHYIITFRTPTYLSDVMGDLKRLYPHGPKEHHFIQIIRCHDGLWNDYKTSQKLREVSIITDPIMTPEEMAFCQWKAKICHENEIPVLIDDMTDLVISGCDKYGISYYHPSDFYR